LEEGPIEAGTPDEASVAVARLLKVTEAAYERRAQLQRALESRVAIEQAKGVLAERYGLDVDQAFDAIRRAARSNRLRLHDLVREIRPGAPTPEVLARMLDV
jgi:AmiR/NasT family two-component response regulator